MRERETHRKRMGKEGGEEEEEEKRWLERKLFFQVLKLAERVPFVDRVFVAARSYSDDREKARVMLWPEGRMWSRPGMACDDVHRKQGRKGGMSFINYGGIELGRLDWSSTSGPTPGSPERNRKRG